MSEWDVQAELDTIERAVHRARGLDGGADDVHPMDFSLPGPRDLKAMRESCGLSKDDVARRVDMAPRSIYQIELGASRPSMKTLQKLLRLYRMEWPRGECE